MKSFNDVFAKVCNYCKDNISSIGYNLWIQVIKPVSFDGQKAVLYVKSDFQKKIISEKYMDLLLQAFEQELGFPVTIEIKCDDELDLETTANSQT